MEEEEQVMGNGKRMGLMVNNWCSFDYGSRALTGLGGGFFFLDIVCTMYDIHGAVFSSICFCWSSVPLKR